MGYSYYDFAEDDYKTVKRLLRDMQEYNEQPTNTMCSLSQKAIEKYLKHLIDVSVDDTTLSSTDLANKERVMRTHTLRDLISFIQIHIPGFVIDNSIRHADGFYFDTNYPGQNSFFVSANDVQDCITALEITKKSVENYLGIN